MLLLAWFFWHGNTITTHRCSANSTGCEFRSVYNFDLRFSFFAAWMTRRRSILPMIYVVSRISTHDAVCCQHRLQHWSFRDQNIRQSGTELSLLQLCRRGTVCHRLWRHRHRYQCSGDDWKPSYFHDHLPLINLFQFHTLFARHIYLYRDLEVFF